jgi:hypothetical protein
VSSKAKKVRPWLGVLLTRVCASKRQRTSRAPPPLSSRAERTLFGTPPPFPAPPSTVLHPRCPLLPAPRRSHISTAPNLASFPCSFHTRCCPPATRSPTQGYNDPFPSARPRLYYYYIIGASDTERRERLSSWSELPCRAGRPSTPETRRMFVSNGGAPRRGARAEYSLTA